MLRVFVTAAAVLLLLTGASALAAGVSPAALKKTYLQLDEQCRGGSGDDPATLRACDQRNVVSFQLREFNICFTPDGFQHCSSVEGGSDIDGIISATKLKNQFGVWDLVITVRADDLTLNAIVVNRNNCQILSVSKSIGVRMKFGDKIALVTVCDPIEVSVETDQGRSVLDWDQ